MTRRIKIIALLSGLLSGCGPLLRQQADEPARVLRVPVALQPLPGRLDDGLLFHSNSPERIEGPGVLLSTLPGKSGPFLERSLQGEFRVFLHHVVRTPVTDPRQIWIGLLAHNRGSGSQSLALNQGNAFLTRPDAPFVPLPTLLANDAGQIFSGPGDRVALATLRGDSNLPPRRWELAPGSEQLLFQWQVPTNPILLLQQDNALSGLLAMSASGNVDLSLVALYQASRPQPADYLTILANGQPAAEPEPATSYDPLGTPPAGAFRYGRVAGLVSGTHWDGQLDLSLPLQHGQGLPVSAVYLKRLGTGQNQSAPLSVRVPGTASESHGNYGTHYRLTLRIDNPTDRPQSLALALQQPVKAEQDVAEFRSPPAEQVRFRGSLRLSEAGQVRWFHLVLREGEQAPAFATLELPPRSRREASLEWIYPADATPPQMLLMAQSLP